MANSAGNLQKKRIFTLISLAKWQFLLQDFAFLRDFLWQFCKIKLINFFRKDKLCLIVIE
jgi:hypothetical protein